MVKAKNDLSNQVFGRLTVINQAEDYVLPNGRKRSRWLCKCECGNETVVDGAKLRNGHTQSCHRCNTYYTDGEVTKVKIKDGSFFLIDTEDVDKIRKYCWYKNDTGYIVRREGNSLKQMHRELLSPPSGKVVDHINGIKTDNRKSNLRICTYCQNSMNMSTRKDNTSGQTGVFWDKQRGKWKAEIVCNKKRIHIGFFTNKDEAIKARQEAEVIYYGEYRRRA